MDNLDLFKEKCRNDMMMVERVIADVMAALLSDEPAFLAVDGGAHTGYHTRLFAEQENCRRVIAIEADPWTVLKLESNLVRLSDAERQKIQVVKAAIQDSQFVERVTWMSAESHPGRSGISSIWQDEGSVTFRPKREVRATTVDRLVVAEELPCRALKLDLEGGDFMALLGAIETLRKHRPLVVFENSVRAPGIYDFKVEQVSAFLAACGYQAVSFHGESPSPSNWFQFWEMWAAPVEKVSALQKMLQRLVAAEIEGASVP